MSWVSCQRGSSAELPPVIVVSESEYVEREAERRRTDNPNRTAEDDAKEVGWNRGLAQFKLAPKSYDRDMEQALQLETLGAVYEPKTRSVVVIDRGRPLNDARAVELLVHELVHALQDASVGFEKFYEKWAYTFDASLAVSGLIEGEALHYQLLANVTLRGQNPGDVDWQAFYDDYRSQVQREADADAYPMTMASRRFPYAFGGAVVTQTWLKHGRPGIDALFDAPPVSTQALLFDDDGVDRTAAVKDVRARGVPDLGDAYEVQGYATLGSWMARMYGARMSLSASKAWRLAESLDADVLSVQRDPATGRSVAAWHVINRPGVSMQEWPGPDALSHVNAFYPPGAEEVFMIADDSGHPPLASDLEWGPVEEQSMPPSTAAPARAMDRIVSAAPLLCPDNVPDLGAYLLSRD